MPVNIPGAGIERRQGCHARGPACPGLCHMAADDMRIGAKAQDAANISAPGLFSWALLCTSPTAYPWTRQQALRFKPRAAKAGFAAAKAASTRRLARSDHFV